MSERRKRYERPKTSWQTLPPPDPRVTTIAASLPFAETLARGLIARLGAETDPLALSRATIYLPTRRAARSFADIFARVLGGAALLPDFKALGDVEEDEYLFDADAEDLGLPPAITPIRRQLLLATLIRRWDETRRGRVLGFAQANALANGLVQLMDELEQQDANLTKLDGLAPVALSEHWTEVAEFLKILRDHWPAIVASTGAMNPIARRNLLLRALAKRLAAHPPEGSVIAAGSTGSIPATGELLAVISRLPDGMVVLPGLDRTLDDDSWQRLDPGHPQYGMRQLLGRIGVNRRNVLDWNDVAPSRDRERVLNETLRPAPTTDAWRALAEGGSDTIARGLAGMSLIEAADPPEEASVVALALREALETPSHTAALVTPDRALARRVAAELERWDISIDDSAGRPLAHTPPGAFLCLLAEAADAGFAPVPLLALLKHPLSAIGDAATFRAHARELDEKLRGPRPDAGLDGVAHAIVKAPRVLRDWFAGVTKALRPLGDALDKPQIHIADVVAAHIQAAEALSHPSMLWRGDAGEKARDLLLELAEASADLPAVEPGSYAPLFHALATKRSVRPAYGKHPRLAILGAQEARLLSFDLVILGGLNEGSWPRAAQTDPWFSRPMREVLGLEQPERAIGLAAHDFATLAAGSSVILTRATKADGAPTVASRWLQRLTQLTNGLDLNDALKPATDYIAIARALGDAGPPERIAMPAPTPPAAARPDHLSVTEIETWVRDPYAIYARRVLGLEPLEQLDAEIGAMERGSAVHKALENFVKEYPGELPDDAAARLCAIADKVFEDLGAPKAALALWRPRILRAARWFVEEERARRSTFTTSLTEIKGRYPVTENFTLTGTADRIDLIGDYRAAILDYKTGKPPRPKQIEAFLAPQLLLEAAMLEGGAFAGAEGRTAQSLLYIWFSGGREAGRIEEVETALVAEALGRLKTRIEKFADPAMPYHSRVAPYRSDVSGDYDHLARVREWSLAGWEAQEE
jgi:ATP-dependent helicase/nuclease subunit B